MTRKDWTTALGMLLLLWLLGGWVWRPVIEQALEERASRELASLEGVEVNFRGQQAVLTGQVRWESQRKEAESLIRERVRASASVAAGLGGGLNPVTQVINEIQVKPLPPGWLMLMGAGKNGHLLGTVASEEEARDLMAAIEREWTRAGGTLTADVGADLSRYDEASEVAATLRSIPKPAGTDEVNGKYVLWAVRVGDPWQRWSLSAVDEVLRRDAMALGVAEEAWDERVLAGIKAMVERRDDEKERLAEEARLAALPPPHVIAARSGGRLLLRGELGSAESKTRLVEAWVEAFPTARILDDLRVTGDRRPFGDFGELPHGAGSDGEIFLSVADGHWRRLDWAASGDKPLEWGKLPKALRDEQVAPDMKVVEDWMRGGNAGIPSLPAPAQPAFLTLAVLPDRVFLAGQVAEEAHRSHLMEAAKRVYGGRREVDTDGLIVRGSCEPTEAVFHTVLGFPAADDGPVLAVAKPGDAWTVVPVTESVLESRRLSVALLPKGIPEGLVTECLAPAFDRIAAKPRNQEGSGL